MERRDPGEADHSERVPDGERVESRAVHAAVSI
jgi:hypothetical protein